MSVESESQNWFQFHTSGSPDVVHQQCGAMACLQHSRICQVHVYNLAPDSHCKDNSWFQDKHLSDIE